MEIDELRRISAKEELSLNFIAKDDRISRILLDLQGIDNIILKGGTAINRVYLKNKRFSEDIDFDLIFNEDIKKALPITKKIITNIKEFTIEKPRIMNQTIRYDLYYLNPLAHKDKIRLEFRIIKKAVGYDKKIINFGFVPFPSSLLNVYSIEQLILQKINCIFSRTEGKDLFDLYYLIDLSKSVKELKEKKDEIIKKIPVEEKQIKFIANTLNHYIPRSQRPSWSLFLQELIEKIEKY